MAEPVARELVAGFGDAANESRITLGDPAQREERRAAFASASSARMRSMFCSTRHSIVSHSLRRDVRRKRRHLEIILDVDRQRIDDRRRRAAIGVRHALMRTDAPPCVPAGQAIPADARRSARPACPSHNSGTRPRLPPVRRISSTHAARRAVAPDEGVRALRYGDRALGVFAHREAGHGQRGRLFLDAAGVRQHQARVRKEAQHLEIALRLEQGDRPRRSAMPSRSDRCSRAPADERATRAEGAARRRAGS